MADEAKTAGADARARRRSRSERAKLDRPSGDRPSKPDDGRPRSAARASKPDGGPSNDDDRPSKSERESVVKARREIRTREEVAGTSTLAQLWANYSLTIVLLIMTIVTLALHAWFGWLQYVADQTSHGETPTLWGDSGYWIYFGEWTFQNWQSEFVQTLILIVLTAYFVHRGSADSKDSQEEMQATLDRIERRLQRIEETGKASS
jgi:hypothetical protein